MSGETAVAGRLLFRVWSAAARKVRGEAMRVRGTIEVSACWTTLFLADGAPQTSNYPSLVGTSFFSFLCVFTLTYPGHRIVPGVELPPLL